MSGQTKQIQKGSKNTKYCSIGQASELLGVSIATLRRWEKSGKIKAERLDGKNRSFKIADLEKLNTSKPLSTAEAAKQLKISESSVRRLQQKGELVGERGNNGKYLFNQEAIDTYKQLKASKKASKASTPSLGEMLQLETKKRLEQAEEFLDEENEGYISPAEIPHPFLGGILAAVATIALLITPWKSINSVNQPKTAPVASNTQQTISKPASPIDGNSIIDRTITGAKLAGETIDISNLSKDLQKKLASNPITNIFYNQNSYNSYNTNNVYNTTNNSGGSTVSAGTGISVTANGNDQTISANYGSQAGTAAEGNTLITCPAGSGNLTGGGNSVAVGAGGTCDSLGIVSNPTFTGQVTAGSLTSGGAITFSGLGTGLVRSSATGALSTNFVQNSDFDSSQIYSNLTKLNNATISGQLTVSGLANGIVKSNAGILSGGNTVSLGSDTTGSYIQNLGTLTGLTTTNNSGAGSTPTLAVAYGSTANTSVQGNTALICPSGTGNLIGTGNTITLGSGGTCNSLSIVDNPTFTGLMTSLGVNAGSGSIQGTGGLSVTGNSTITGTLTGLTGLTVASGGASITGNSSITGILDVSGNLRVNTNKFTVASSTGNTSVAGTLGVAGNLNISTNKFNVTAASGNTSIAGTLSVSGDTLISPATNSVNAFKVQNSTGGNIFTVDTANEKTIISSPTNGVAKIVTPDIYSIGDSQSMIIVSGNADIAGGASGAVQISSGNGYAYSGGISIYTGYATNGSSGDLYMDTGGVNDGWSAGNINIGGIATSVGLGSPTSINSTLYVQSTASFGSTLNVSGGANISLGINNNSGGITNTGGLTGVTNYTQTMGNFAIAGSGTFSTGTGAVSINGITTLKPSANSATAFQVQNTSSTAILTVDTSSNRVGINRSGSLGYDLDVNGTGFFGGTGKGLYVNGFNQTFGNSSILFQVQTSGRAAALGVDTTSSSVTTPNLISNGDFEGPSPLLGWSAKNGSTNTSSSIAWQGVNSMQASTGTTANAGAFFPVTLAANTTYTLSFYARTFSGNVNDLDFGRQDLSGTDINCAANNQITPTWKRFSCSFTTGSSVSSSNVYFQRNTTNNVTFYVDGFQLQTGTVSTGFNVGAGVFVGGVINSPITFQNKSDSTNSFQIQNSGGINLLNVDTLTNSNLLTNGNLESAATTGWSIKNSATSIAAVTSSTTAPQEGVYSLQTVGSTTANSGVSIATSVSASTTYTLSFYAKIASGTPNTDFVYGRQDNGADITCATGQTISQTWQRFTCTFTTGATISSPNLFFQKSGTSAYTFYIDNVILRQGQSAAPGGIQIFAPITSGLTLQNNANSTTALQVQNAAGTNLLTVDSTNQQVAVGPAAVPANGVLTIGTNTTAATGGLYFGTDANLYRSGTGNRLQSDGSLKLTGSAGGASLQTTQGIWNQGSSSGGTGLYLGVSGDLSSSRISISNAGKISWGDGTVAPGDTVLYRASAGVLKTDTGLTVAGNTALSPTTDTNAVVKVQNAATATILNVDTTITSNLINKGDFEGTGTTGWTAKNGATLSSTTTYVWQSGTSMSVATTVNNNDGAYYSYSLAANTQYTLSLYARTASGTFTDIAIGRQDVAGTDINCLSSQSVTSGWNRYFCTFTTGATVTSPNVFIKKTGAVAETFYIDGVQLQTGSTASAFNPGGVIQLSGIINSPVAIQNRNNSVNAFTIQNSVGASILNQDTVSGDMVLGQGNMYIGAYPPIVSNLTCSSTGGTLGAGLYSYKVAALTPTGWTNVSLNNSNCNSSGTTNLNTFSWNAIPVTGASSYRVYRAMSSSNTWFYNDVAGTSTSLIDDGTTYTWTNSIALPTSNASSGGTLNVATDARVAGKLTVNNIDFANPGPGNTSQFQFLKTSDSAAIKVAEISNDQTDYVFYMADNPDGGDNFMWSWLDWQNLGSGWNPLNMTGLTNTFTGLANNFYGPLNMPALGAYATGNTTNTTYNSNTARYLYQPLTTSTAVTRDAGTGTGVLNWDASGYTGSGSTAYWLRIDGTGTFSWGNASNTSTAVATGVAITGGWQTLSNGVQVRLPSGNANYAVNDRWSARFYPASALTVGGTNSIGTFSVYAPANPTKSAAVIRAASAYGNGTQNLQEWQNNSGTALAKIDNAGALTVTVASGSASFALCTATNGAGTKTIEDCVGSASADYAEQYPVASGINYGDIVATGSKLVNTYDQENGAVNWNKVKGQVTELVKTESQYQGNTVGVVSDNHGDFTSAGNNIKDEDNPMPVALNGRVPVNMAPDSEPVSAGDYLTTSGTYPGKATKATGAGYVIGKALAGWSPGQEQVMVFVEPGYNSGPTALSYIQDGGSAILASLTVNGTLEVKGLLKVADIEVNGHIITRGDTPQITAKDAAGASATVSIDGNDTAGTITINTGSGAGAGDLAEVTFAKMFGSKPRIILSPSNDKAAKLQIYKSSSKTGFVLKSVAGTGQTEDNSSYEFDYQIMQ